MSKKSKKHKTSKQDKEVKVIKAEHAKALAKQGLRTLAKSDAPFTVASLESALLKEFPREDAEDWDVMGLIVGEGTKPVKSVAVALDPTVSAITKAADIGADVLITHHPLFLEPPCTFAPELSVALNPGAGVWAAIRCGVACMNFHTALDVSKKAQMALPNLLGLTYTGQVVEPIATSRHKGYGQLCTVSSASGKPESLAHIAAKCTSVFGRAPRVWGNFDMRISTIVTALGSAAHMGEQALALKADCMICGEVKYHEALELAEAGLAIIELGHDVSELPLTAILAKAVADAGISQENITIIDQTDNWSYPEAIRL